MFSNRVLKKVVGSEWKDEGKETCKATLGYPFQKGGLHSREEAEQSRTVTREAEATSGLSVSGRGSGKDK